MEPIKIRLQPIDSTKEVGKAAFLKRIFSGTSSRQSLAILLFLVTAVSMPFLINDTGVAGGTTLLVIVISLPAFYFTITKPSFGITLLLLMAYLLFSIMKLGISFPLGTLMDGLELLLIIGLLFQLKVNKDWHVFKNPISILLLIWIGYNLLQVINPSAESRLAWLYTVRTVAMISVVYFIFLYNIRTVTFIRFILKLWLVLSFIGAAYGIKQEFIGFSASELEWLHSDPAIEGLLFINGHWRIFSIFSDPVAFAYNMLISSLLCIALITGPFEIWKKIVLAFLAAFFLFAMIYSGTRGAYVLLPAALALFAILKFNKKVLIFAVISGFFLAALIVVPTSNPTLYRFQSAFKPSNDASFNLRKANQKRIQPYILTHPMGGGLGATGVWGTRFAPHSYLANFPPDSGYVRVAVELGWIGLFLFCLLMFTILKIGINNYYLIKNPELKTYCLAMILIVFALNIGNYPQEALVQFPTNIYFYLVVALIIITKRLDEKRTELKNKAIDEKQNKNFLHARS